MILVPTGVIDVNVVMTDIARRKVEATQGMVLYTGRPSWLTDRTLDELAAEAAALRHTARENRQQQFGASAGDHAMAFARSHDLLSLVRPFASPQCSCAEGTYLYYERPGAGIAPHIDRPEFALQILLMLHHSGYSKTRSSLAVFPDGPKSVVYFPLEPGELILFQAANVAHGRTPTADGEVVKLLGLGFA